MDFKDFEDLIKALKINADRWAKRRQKHHDEIRRKFCNRTSRGTKLEDATRRELYQILDGDFSNTSNCFKIGIVDFFNDNYSDFYKDESPYLLFRQALIAHLNIKYQYYDLRIAFGYKDSDKYVRKNNTYIGNYKTQKIKYYMEPALSPYAHLKFFAIHMKEYMNIDLTQSVYTKAREKEKYKTELIHEVMMIILCDCTNYLPYLRKTLRITTSNKSDYDDTMAEYEKTVFENKPIIAIKP